MDASFHHIMVKYLITCYKKLYLYLCNIFNVLYVYNFL